jgi:secondary thiamine-phosphate synthase enzyme
MMYRKTISIQTQSVYDFVDLTEEVQHIIAESKVKDGMVFINNLHNTAALLVQEADPSIHRDLTKVLDKIAPLKERWEHSYEGAVNATAHLKQNLLASCLIVPVEKGNLMLGTWQRLFFIELFEARSRKVIVTVMGK